MPQRYAQVIIIMVIVLVGVTMEYSEGNESRVICDESVAESLDTQLDTMVGSLRLERTFDFTWTIQRSIRALIKFAPGR
jgi:hypothetical protein